MVAGESRYLNRELSWLEFNQRVLDEALNLKVPLLERLKFLAISASNLDEFFMVRVGSLQTLREQGNHRPDPAGLTATEQLREISRRAHLMVREQYACYHGTLEPQLAALGMRRISIADLNERMAKALDQVFEEEIFPVLTPIAIPHPDDFPLLINQTISIAVRLAPGHSFGEVQESPDRDDQPAPPSSRFAVIPFGAERNRFITLPSDSGYCFMLLEDVIEHYISRFFPGEPILECVPFRMTRNADIEVREDQASDLLAEMQKGLAARAVSDCVRLEIAHTASDVTTAYLRSVLEVDVDDLFQITGPLDLSAFMKLTDSQGFDAHRYEPWPPQAAAHVDAAISIFENISRGDFLLYHPYESFDPVLRFLQEAADDPDVIAIKQTLYRTSRNSPIVAALRRAAMNKKYVTAVVELKARFDEARNMQWARNLEQAGVQVIYGVKGLKIHAKVCLIVRRGPQGIQRFVHFGTGNYNELTARQYGDASLLTCNEDLGADASALFNAITGYTQPQRFREIEAAPIGLREKLLELIEGEIRSVEHGQHGEILAKLNSLVDAEMIAALYAASNAGVKIRLSVRGICCLRPGIPGLSENISVTSVIDRFLEHSRILYFASGGKRRVYISSADWMPRNLDRRVELLIPVNDAKSKDKLISILKLHLNDTAKAKILQPDGSYLSILPRPTKEPLRSQQELYRKACRAFAQAEEEEIAIFEPYRAPGVAEF